MSSLESDIKYCVSKYGARLDDYIVDTVFFGGGTPSYVSPQLIAGICIKKITLNMLMYLIN